MTLVDFLVVKLNADLCVAKRERIFANALMRNFVDDERQEEMLLAQVVWIDGDTCALPSDWM